jgi:HEAT repeat protein
MLRFTRPVYGAVLALLALHLLAPAMFAQPAPAKPDAQPGDTARLENREEDWRDRVVARFIDYDAAQETGGRPWTAEEAKQALAEFHSLDARAIPALVRGLNQAAINKYSCPVMVIAAKLLALASTTDDATLLAYAAQHAGDGMPQPGSGGRGPGEAQAVRVVYRKRLEAVVTGKLTALTARDLAVRQLYPERADVVRAALKHAQADVRWGAVRVAAARNLRCEAELIDLLADPDQDVQQVAQLALVHFSHGLNLGPEPGAADKDRTQAAEEWRRWWEAKQVGNDLARAKGEKWEKLLAQLRDGKGAYFTLALAEAIRDMAGDGREQARDALAERLTRMTAKTLADKLADENVEVRRAAVRAVVSKGGADNVPNLIPLLRDKNPEVAALAHKALTQLCGQDFGPDAGARDAERAEAVKKWRAWWDSRPAAPEK